MSDYSLNELEYWAAKVEEAANELGLRCYEQEFELVSYEEMTSYEAYSGMPSRYPHWSYGKAYEKIRTLNKYNLSGLPYEMVINSDPCIAYLMKDNTLLLQILTMAHVYGHNDFFRNNRLFVTSARAKYTLDMFKSHADHVRNIISMPGIGYTRMERVLNAAHALRYQCLRTVGDRPLDEEEVKYRMLRESTRPNKDFPLLMTGSSAKTDEPDMKRVPLQPQDDLLRFISNYGNLEAWEKDILDMVREETLYFIPQIETKIMNEGWACFWHDRIIKRLDLPQGMYLEYLRRHNQVVKPFDWGINPYYLGFRVFEKLADMHSDDPVYLFGVRKMERDESFLRRYLTRELCTDLHLYEYEKEDHEYVVSEVADEEGWIKIRNTLANSAGMSAIPVIRVTDLMQREHAILLEHQYDGRELEINYANETLRHIADLWQGKVMLNTVLEGRNRVLICDEQKKILLVNT